MIPELFLIAAFALGFVCGFIGAFVMLLFIGLMAQKGPRK